MFNFKEKSSGSPVIFIPWIEDGNNSIPKNIFSFEEVLIYKMFHLLDGFSSSEVVGIKYYSEEVDSSAIIDPLFIESLCKVLDKHKFAQILCDTSWKYNNRHDNITKHYRRLTKSNFSSNSVPFVLLDGLNGEQEITIDLKNKISNISLPMITTEPKKDFFKAHLAGLISDLGGIIILTRPQSHPKSGINGAIKNLGFGLSSKKGKLKQYSQSMPKVNPEKCTLCGKCIANCPTNAISRGLNRHVVIDYSLCVDCGRCVNIAYFGGVFYDFDATPEFSQTITAIQALGAMEVLQKKVVFCNFLHNYHLNLNGEKKLINIGILISKDPVAIDYATLDIIKEYNPELLEQVIDTTLPVNKLLSIAETLKIGKKDYDLITVAY